MPIGGVTLEMTRLIVFIDADFIPKVVWCKFRKNAVLHPNENVLKASVEIGEDGASASKYFHPRWLALYISGVWHTRTLRGRGQWGLPPFYSAVPARCSGCVGCLKCPVFLFMLRERRDRAGGAEMGFYTLFIVALLQFDKERGSPGLHATLPLGGALPPQL